MPLEPNKKPIENHANPLGFGSVLIGSVLAVGLTGVVLWQNEMPWVWAFLLYPVFGMLLTFLFAALSILLFRKEKAAPTPTPQSGSGPLRSRKQKPPH